jgi:hypothetical protein
VSLVKKFYQDYFDWLIIYDYLPKSRFAGKYRVNSVFTSESGFRYNCRGLSRIVCFTLTQNVEIFNERNKHILTANMVCFTLIQNIKIFNEKGKRILTTNMICSRISMFYIDTKYWKFWWKGQAHADYQYGLFADSMLTLNIITKCWNSGEGKHHHSGEGKHHHTTLCWPKLWNIKQNMLFADII